MGGMTQPGRPLRHETRNLRHKRWVLRLLEYVVTALVILLLMLRMLSRTEALQVEAERLSMQGVVRSLEAAVLLASILEDGRRPPEFRPGGNPMALIEQRPANYLGEFDGADPEAIAGGQWYFDARQRTLLYRVRHADYFQTPLPAPARARFKVAPTDDGTPGLAVIALEPYRWLKKP